MTKKTKTRECKRCGGEGKFSVTIFGIMADLRTFTCPDCKGSGKTVAVEK